VPSCSKLLISILLILVTANASAETNVCNAGIGGTGIQQDGIGGTGHQQEGIGGTGKQASSGVGGTGAQANSGVGGTGIVGVITGFASVCVNGLEVHYDNKTKVDVDGQTSAINALYIGQLVAIESIDNGDLLEAERISVSHIMVGKIEKIDVAQYTLQILGQTVSYSRNTYGSANLKLNQAVQLSGLVAANNQIYALRIDPVAPSTPSSIVGVIDSAGKINGVNISSSKPINAGNSVQVSGNWNGRALQASQIKESAMQHLLKGTENVVIQGIAPLPSKGNIYIQNQTIYVNDNTKISGENTGTNQTVIVYGKIDRAGKINARSIEYSGIDKILERGGSKHRPDSGDLNATKSVKEHAEHKSNDNDKMESKDRLNKPEKSEKPDKVEKPEKIEKPAAIERPETIQRPPVIERPIRLEIPEIEGH